MVTLVGSQIWWTWETEDVFRRVREGGKHAMKDFATKLTGQLTELTTMVRPWAPARAWPLAAWDAAGRTGVKQVPHRPSHMPMWPVLTGPPPSMRPCPPGAVGPQR